MEKLSEQLRRAVLGVIDAGIETRYSIAKNARVNAAAFYRWLDEGRDIKISTADLVAEYLRLRLIRWPEGASEADLPVEQLRERSGPGEGIAAEAPGKPNRRAAKRLKRNS
jgi:hypothetical protein